MHLGSNGVKVSQAWTDHLDLGPRAHKRAPRAGFVSADAEQDAEDRISGALAGDISIVYQPIANLHNGRVVGFESLSRFNDVRPPDVWFKEAASIGRGVELELAAVRFALANIKSLPKGAYLSVNVSPEAALSPDLVDILERLPADRIV